MNDIIVAAITAGLPAVVTVFNVLYTNRKARRNNQTAAERKELEKQQKILECLKLGTQCLLRVEIIRQHEKYVDRGFCPVYAKESLTKIYQAYHTLGGNDVATALYEQLMALPNE